MHNNYNFECCIIEITTLALWHFEIALDFVIKCVLEQCFENHNLQIPYFAAPHISSSPTKLDCYLSIHGQFCWSNIISNNWAFYILLPNKTIQVSSREKSSFLSLQRIFPKNTLTPKILKKFIVINGKKINFCEFFQNFCN